MLAGFRGPVQVQLLDDLQGQQIAAKDSHFGVNIRIVGIDVYKRQERGKTHAPIPTNLDEVEVRVKTIGPIKAYGQLTCP